MRHFLITVLGTIIGLFIFFVLLFVILGSIGAAISSTAKSSKSQKSASILTLDLRTPLRDHSAGAILFGIQPNSVVDIARRLHKAKTDNQVKGLFIRANEFAMVPASAEEIRLAIADFKESGKPVITHSQGFEGTSVLPYMAISASDEIWQQSTSNFSAAGIRSEMGFYGGIFEKYDVKVQFEQFYEYKNAANVYKEKGLTPAHKEATSSYLTSIFESAIGHIAKDRNIQAQKVRDIFDAAPHSAETAQEKGLIDKLGHVEAAKSYLQKKAGGDKVKFKPLKTYSLSKPITAPAIAFIGGQGSVVTGKSLDGSNPFRNGLTMGSDTIAEAFDAAIKDKKVKAIIFRVSTPGGSPSAADQIHDAVARARESGKPVIISMGQYAASAGYYISANADKIIALPTTITGSIGVLGGKIALRDTFAKFGYNIDDVNIGGEYVSAFSGDEPFTQAQQAAFRSQLTEIYEDFTSRVAEGRDIPLDTVLDIAKGRVWTGTQGQERQLVDEMGGFMKAVSVAKSLSDIEPETKVYIKQFPRPKTAQQQFEALIGGSAQTMQDLQALREISTLPEVQALIKARQNNVFNYKDLHSQSLRAPLADIQ